MIEVGLVGFRSRGTRVSRAVIRPCWFDLGRHRATQRQRGGGKISRRAKSSEPGRIGLDTGDSLIVLRLRTRPTILRAAMPRSRPRRRRR